MKSYKTIIIDDERLAREEVKRALSAYPEFMVLGEAANVDEAMVLIEKERRRPPRRRPPEQSQRFQRHAGLCDCFPAPRS